MRPPPGLSPRSVGIIHVAPRYKRSKSQFAQLFFLQITVNIVHMTTCACSVKGSCCDLRQHECKPHNRGLNNKCYDDCMCEEGEWGGQTARRYGGSQFLTAEYHKLKGIVRHLEGWEDWYPSHVCRVNMKLQPVNARSSCQATSRDSRKLPVPAKK